jgi:hypothetical protein
MMLVAAAKGVPRHSVARPPKSRADAARRIAQHNAIQGLRRADVEPSPKA